MWEPLPADKAMDWRREECEEAALPTMVSEAVKLIEDLFTADNASVWSVSFPSKPAREVRSTHSGEATTSTPTRPPSSSRSYDVLPMAALPDKSQSLSSVLAEVGKALLQFVRGPPGNHLPHNSSFWTVFFNTLIIEMSGGLLIRRGYERSEADIRNELISPLLKRVAHSMSSFVAPMEWDGESEYASSLVVESNTERRLHTPGSKPAVDYCLVGRTGRDQIVYKVPVEVKKTYTFEDMGQLANYMGALGKVGGQGGITGVGFLMDENCLKLAVAPLRLGVSGDGPLLPFVFFGPSVPWRDGSMLRRDACIAILSFATITHSTC